jgi:NAD-dependent dihydropyrimidine dehydrogenase PreA subunit
MTHVVTDNCHLCRFTDCVTVCPVECFHADEERTYIDPEVCIDCGACIPACPVHAIYDALDMPDDRCGTVSGPSRDQRQAGAPPRRPGAQGGARILTPDVQLQQGCGPCH